MKRAFDVVLALLLGVLALIPCIIVSLMVKLTSRGPVLYWSQRVGRGNALFAMPKFRTMKMDTPAVATHLLSDPQTMLTPVGSILRRSSLDELPQLWSILRGDMSFVGPRPALFNQHDLIALRDQAGVSIIRPGLTGWAQVNGRDALSLESKVEFDAAYMARRGFGFDLWILVLTFLRVIGQTGVKH